jgi:hypothetical protein
MMPPQTFAPWLATDLAAQPAEGTGFMRRDAGAYDSQASHYASLGNDRPDPTGATGLLTNAPFGFAPPNQASEMSPAGTWDGMPSTNQNPFKRDGAGPLIQLAQYAPARPGLPILPGPFLPGSPENTKWAEGFIGSHVRAGREIGNWIRGILHNESDDPADKPAETPIGRRGQPIKVIPGTNKPADIGGRIYSGHGIDQMQGRGVTPTPVEDVIQNGQKSPGNNPGEMVHEAGGVRVVTGADGQVITVVTIPRGK